MALGLGARLRATFSLTSWLKNLLLRVASAFARLRLGSTTNALLQTKASIFGFRHSSQLDSGHIRLLRLPVSSACPSPCPELSIETFPVVGCPPYIALSYTWGPPEPSMTPYPLSDRRIIRIDGRPFLVFPNLFDALTQLVSARPGQYVWIDGICINQADLAERASQVSIMNTIYAGAEETVIWLGSSSPATERALSKLEEMATNAESQIVKWGKEQSFGDAFIADDAQALERSGLPPMTRSDWSDLAAVLTRTWFSRVWIIQEVALSSNPTILVGHRSIPWSSLGNAALLVVGSNAISGIMAFGSGVQDFSLVQGVVFATNLQILREWCRGDESPFRDVIRNHDFLAGIDIDDHSLSAALLKVLLISKGCQSTCRQDRVYGLLGIVNHIAKWTNAPVPSLAINYSSSPDKVLTDIGLFLYHETGSLHLLSLAGEASRSRVSATTIPSWIPSFEIAHVPILGPNYKRVSIFNASGSYTAEFQLDKAQRRLNVKAASPNLGSIEELGEAWPDLLAGKFLNTITILLHCGETYKSTNQPIVESLWRALIMDTNLFERPAPSALSSSFKSWFLMLTVTAILKAFIRTPRFAHDIFDSLEPLFVLSNSRDSTNLLPTSEEMIHLLRRFGCFPDPAVPAMTEPERNEFMERLGREAESYEGLVRATLPFSRRLARTVRGLLCLVPLTAQIGDRVMIVKGCPTPLVMRRVPEEEDAFRLVGDTYVHGVMYGEHVATKVFWRDIVLI
ncbi:unnamed protein product [Clonostachys solani]|uniref:Heterokaryon incompatibility domain-containing protein n=1 Tax=Clonostachys solani TaxID=160281 RepID=A0A9N9ZNK2_9HYPO|nr:unnamed protein product [Clonostachys solani]